MSASLLLALSGCKSNDQVTSSKQGESLTESSEVESLASSLASSEDSIAINPSSESAASSKAATFNTTILQNAIQESLTKPAVHAVSTNPKVKLGIANYKVTGTDPNFTLTEVSTNNNVIQAGSITTDFALNGSNQDNPLEAHVNFNNITTIVGAVNTVAPSMSLTNQDANIYFTNKTLYWDFLDENGQECSDIATLAGLLATLAVSQNESGDDVTDFVFQTKGKYVLDSEMGDTLTMLAAMIGSPLISSSLTSNTLDPLLQSLWTNGADMSTTDKTENGEKIYNTKIKVDDASIIQAAIEEMQENSSSSGATGLLPSSTPTTLIDDGEDLSDYLDTFNLELEFVYSVTSLKSSSTSLKFTVDEAASQAEILAGNDLVAGDSKTSITSFELSSSDTFTFSDSLQINFPSFDNYTLQVIPEATEEEEVLPPSSDISEGE